MESYKYATSFLPLNLRSLNHDAGGESPLAPGCFIDEPNYIPALGALHHG
jgi:hypothetical protein